MTEKKLARTWWESVKKDGKLQIQASFDVEFPWLIPMGCKTRGRIPKTLFMPFDWAIGLLKEGDQAEARERLEEYASTHKNPLVQSKAKKPEEKTKDCDD